MPRPFALTPGEPAGIGPDLCLLLSRQAQPHVLVAVASRALLANPHWPLQAARALGIERPAWVLPAPYAHWLERYQSA